MGGGLDSSLHMGGGSILVPSLGDAAQTAACAFCDPQGMGRGGFSVPNLGGAAQAAVKCSLAALN